MTTNDGYCPLADNGCTIAKDNPVQFDERCSKNYSGCPIYFAHKFSTLEDGRPVVMAPQSPAEFIRNMHLDIKIIPPVIGERAISETREILFKHGLILQN
jgi:hypothetical protein